MPIPGNIAGTVIQAYLQHMYATFSGCLTFITVNRKEFKNELLKKKKPAEEFGIKH